MLGACTRPPHLCIIMELCENGSLFDLLHEDEIEAMERMQQQQQGEAGKLGIEKKRERRGPGFKCDEKWLIDAATDVARAMSYLHGLVRRRAYVYMHDEKLGQKTDDALIMPLHRIRKLSTET